MKEKAVNPLTKPRAKYKGDKWKWTQNLMKNISLQEIYQIQLDDITFQNLRSTYGLDRVPKNMPCLKKCSRNMWCLADVKSSNTYKGKSRPTDLPRDRTKPIGLQNTANTCWINSAIQALFHLPKFRNVINEVDGFYSEECFSSLIYILQGLFIEMDFSSTKALPCVSGSMFELLGLFATREIMKKDCDHEVLKCVSEFLENAIDTLMIDPKVAPKLNPLFNITLTRVARWECPSCKQNHQQQMTPAQCYTMAAYVSCDECPLDQCLLDLQAETQTGVTLECPCCLTTVKTERIVTPKIQNLPEFLIIRNNSLMDKDLKKRMHVVYPETLDLQNHMLDQSKATYNLSAVIFHHGHWSKHFTAHVLIPGKKWYNFNDEYVSELSNRISTTGIPETHKNYLSNIIIGNKYKNRQDIRISNGAFVWVYVKEGSATIPEENIATPQESIVEYVIKKQTEREDVNIETVESWRTERKRLLDDLAIKDISKPIGLVAEAVLNSWIISDQNKFTPAPSLLTSVLCKHKKFSPMKSEFLKCVDLEMMKSLVNKPLGIHSEEESLPIYLSIEDGMCKQCTFNYSSHILFMEKIRNLQKDAKKMAKKEHTEGTKVIGGITLEQWPKLALDCYNKENCLDTEEEIEENIDDTVNNGEAKEITDTTQSKTEVIDNGTSSTDSGCDINENNQITNHSDHKNPLENGKDITPDLDKSGLNGNTLKEEPGEVNVNNNNNNNNNKVTPEYAAFNEDIVCHHNLLDPNSVYYYLSDEIVSNIVQLCSDALHPATSQDDFDVCPECLAILKTSQQVCNDGKQQRKELTNLFWEKKRPHPVKDVQKDLYLLSRDFFHDWRTFIRSCEKSSSTRVVPSGIENGNLFCKHNNLTLVPKTDDEDVIILWDEEWGKLSSLYKVDHVIMASYDTNGNLITKPGPCDQGCVEQRLKSNFEEQFIYENEVIYVRQVNDVSDIPTRIRSNIDLQCDIPRKRQRVNTQQTGTASRKTNAKLIRASNNFSSTHTLKDIQNFIADRTSIWPMLQTLWIVPLDEEGEQCLEPKLLTDEERVKTLQSLRIKPGDTIYFRAAVEDMEKAAGDGISEFNEIFT